MRMPLMAPATTNCWICSVPTATAFRQAWGMTDAAAPLPLPLFAEWTSFPFVGEMSVRAIDPPVIPEPPRHGEDPADCRGCETPDERFLWVDDRWRLQVGQPSGAYLLLFLTPRAHHDSPDLPMDLASELGVVLQKVERAILASGEVGRVHFSKWGDGGAHLHWWIIARPIGVLQLRGTFLSLWDDILPPPPTEVWSARATAVADLLVRDGGWIPQRSLS